IVVIPSLATPRSPSRRTGAEAKRPDRVVTLLTMPADDDEPNGPPPHPLDRVWFHPSELGGSVTALPPQPAAARVWVAVALALLTGIPGTLGVVLAVGGVGRDTASTSRDARSVTTSLTDPDAVATLVTTVGRSVVSLTAMPAAGADPVVTGSGVVVAPGRVLTAAHLLTGRSAPSVVTLGGQIGTTQVVGIDPETDLALLKVDGADL